MRGASFVVVDGFYKLDVPCPNCGALDGWDCRPSEWPKCWRCGVKVLRFGRTPLAKCVTPNGRIDGHMKYVSGIAGKLRCAFCGKGGINTEHGEENTASRSSAARRR